jgi:hypothetical protein
MKQDTLWSITRALLRLHARQAQALADEIAEGGFLPHTETCTNVEARLRKLAADLRALEEDITLDTPKTGE